MRPAQQNAGLAVTTVETSSVPAPNPARQTFGLRDAVPQAGDTPAKPLRWGEPSTIAMVKATTAGYLGALRADAADLMAYALTASRQWLRDFSIYFAGLLRNANIRRPALSKAVATAPLRRRERSEPLIRFFAYAGGAAALAYALAHFLQPPPVAAAVEPAPRPEWLTVAKPYAAFELSLPDSDEESRYAIMRHADGGGRKDILTFGDAGRSLRYAMVEIYRPGSEFEGADGVASEIAARTRDLDLDPAGEIRPALPLNTKFGPVSTVEFTFGRFGVGHCIGFMRTDAEPSLQITGLSCAMNRIESRKAVACMLDRLTLVSAGSDPDIAKYFAGAELKRTFCGQRDPLLYATPKRDYGPSKAPATGLRGRISAR